MGVGKLTKEKIEKWVAKLPVSEKDVPYFVVGDELATPQQTLTVLSDTKPARSRLSDISFGKGIGKFDIIVEQVKARIANFGDELMMHTLSGESYTPQAMLDEILADTDTGKKFRQKFQMLHDYYIAKLET